MTCFHIQVSISFDIKENGENEPNNKCGMKNEYFPTNENKEIIFDEEDEIIITESKLDILKNNTNHLKRNNRRSSESEIDPEDDFHPELFGLLDNPGVLRFDDLDYPLQVT